MDVELVSVEVLLKILSVLIIFNSFLLFFSVFPLGISTFGRMFRCLFLSCDLMEELDSLKSWIFMNSRLDVTQFIVPN
jgi:hypothetical protein